MLLIGAQLAGVAVTEPAAPPRLINLHLIERCASSSGQSNEVVVCGRRDQDRYRVKALPSGVERSSGPEAELSLGDAKVGAATQQVMIGGIPSNRIMVSVKIPF